MVDRTRSVIGSPLGTMGRSTIVSEVLLFACFVVLVKIPEITSATNTTLLYAKDGFLAGEETPVWVAKVKGHRVEYKRIRTRIVLESLNYWNSLKQNGGFPVRVGRLNDWVTFPEDSDSTEYGDGLRDPREVRFPSPRPVEKRSTDENKVLYPSVLVVMHYNSFYPSINRTHWSVKEMVLYALAFWGTVDNSLRNIQNPRVSLRIAGIIIVQTRQASPYLAWNDGQIPFAACLCPMIGYWTTLANENRDFPIGSYDIIAHMTDLYPLTHTDQCSYIVPRSNAILGAATDGPPCINPNNLGGLIVYDDVAFDGVHRAIGQISKVLGGNEEVQKGWQAQSAWPRRTWTNETLMRISHALEFASCMSAPKEYHPPGAPVPPILAGELMPSEKQCEVWGYGSNAETCWNAEFEYERSSCVKMHCTKENATYVCLRAGLTLDGTLCNAKKTKICLDGECVDKP